MIWRENLMKAKPFEKIAFFLRLLNVFCFVLFAGAKKDATNKCMTPLAVAIEANKTATAEAIRNFSDAGVFIIIICVVLMPIKK